MNNPQSLSVVIISLLGVAVLLLVANLYLDKTYSHDDDAHDFTMYGYIAAFSSIGIVMLMVFLHYVKVMDNIYLPLYSFLFAAFAGLGTVSYLAYDKLISSKHYPIGSVNTKNNDQIDETLTAFVLSIVGATCCLVYFLNYTGGTGLFGEYHDAIEKDTDVTFMINELNNDVKNL